MILPFYTTTFMCNVFVTWSVIGQYVCCFRSCQRIAFCFSTFLPLESSPMDAANMMVCCSTFQQFQLSCTHPRLWRTRTQASPTIPIFCQISTLQCVFVRSFLGTGMVLCGTGVKPTTPGLQPQMMDSCGLPAMWLIVSGGAN